MTKTIAEPNLGPRGISYLAFTWSISVALATFPFRYKGLLSEQDIAFLYRPLCWAEGHNWADETKWGVEPVCLFCNKRRGT